MTRARASARLSFGVLTAALTLPAAVHGAQVFTQDVVIQNSLCVGFDCPSAPSFGSDTIRLQENNLRIHFDDTSSSGSFPNNDWRLIANDQGNGERNIFILQDATAGRDVFAVEAGAPANTLYVESDGDVGIKTANPVVDLHIVEGNTPTVRLEQDVSDGFTAQIWDIAGNEANFFVRDVTNSSLLPFKIKPGADNNAIFIDENGDVGSGVTDNGPDTDLHIRRSESFATFRLEATGASPNTFGDITFTDAGAEGEFRFNIDANDSHEFAIKADGSAEVISPASFNFFRISANGASPNRAADFVFTDAGGNGEFRVNIVDTDGPELALDAAGNLSITGTLSQGSDRARKSGIVPVDGAEILAKVRSLPVAEWSWQGGAETRHIGPMAQDFHAIFGTGEDATRIGVLDASGVALAAIQELAERTDRLAARTDALEAENAALRALFHGAPSAD